MFYDSEDDEVGQDTGDVEGGGDVERTGDVAGGEDVERTDAGGGGDEENAGDKGKSLESQDRLVSFGTLSLVLLIVMRSRVLLVCKCRCKIQMILSKFSISSLQMKWLRTS